MEFSPPLPLHFFKPLLPGFLQEFLIPDAFFQHHFHGSESRSLILKTSSGKRWPVTLIGRRFADGWSKFAAAHDLDVGDFLVFALHGNVFDVKVFGKSACEKIYPPMYVEQSHSLESNQSSEDEYMAESDDEKLSEKSSEDSMASFKGVVTSLNVLHIPKSFAKVNDLRNRCCKMVLIAGGGRSWPVKISQGRKGDTSIRTGWHQFCQSNSLKLGDIFTFEMIDDGSHPIANIIIGNTADIENSPDTKVPNQKDDSQSNTNSDVTPPPDINFGSDVATIYANSVNGSMLYLSKRFSEMHHLNNKLSSVVLTNTEGQSWPAFLGFQSCTNQVYIGQGWDKFCDANGLKAGDNVMVTLIIKNPELVFRIDSECSGQKPVSPKFPKECCVVAAPNPRRKGSQLRFPVNFSKENRLGEELGRDVILRNEKGALWRGTMKLVDTRSTLHVGCAWRRFANANRVKQGDILMLKIMREGGLLYVNVKAGLSKAEIDAAVFHGAVPRGFRI